MQEDLTVLARFWAKVDKSASCWIWQASLFSGGYGQFKYHGQPIGAHVFAWMLIHGPVPRDGVVAHHCDTPACVREAHLFLTTAAGNAADRKSKSRSASGERNGRAILSREAVENIRTLWSSGSVTMTSIAQSFGVSLSQVGRIVRREQWK